MRCYRYQREWRMRTGAVGIRAAGWERHITEGKLPAQGIQTVLCSHCCAICHVLYPVTKYSTQSEAWPEKALRTPKSWSLIITPGAHPPPQKEPSSAPSDLPGTHCMHFVLYLKSQAKTTGAGFSAFMAIQHCSGAREQVFLVPFMKFHNAGMRCYKTTWSFQSVHLFQWLKNSDTSIG